MTDKPQPTFTVYPNGSYSYWNGRSDDLALMTWAPPGSDVEDFCERFKQGHGYDPRTLPTEQEAWLQKERERLKPKLRKPFVALCVASRGWGSYRTIASVMDNLGGYPHAWHFAIGEPLPQAQNTVARKALSDPRTEVLWYVEDDHVIPPDALDTMLAMLSADMPVVGIDYSLRNGPRCVIRGADGEVELVGLGCTVLHRSAFELLPDPPFWVDTRKTWDGRAWVDTGIPEHAGMFDVNLCIAVRAAGKRIGSPAHLEAGHLMLVRGGGHVNHGTDTETTFGGVGLPWAPIPKGATMAAVYLKSPTGTVLDIDPELGGDPTFYLNNGWEEITKAQYDAAMKAADKAANAEKAGE